MEFLRFEPISFRVQGLSQLKLPPFVRIRQRYEKDALADPCDHLRKEIRRQFGNQTFSGRTFAVTVGSRGIPHLVDLLKTLIEEIHLRQGLVFLIPSMGSHGGATAQGQLDILAGYGITEESMGVPIRSTMEVDEVGQLADGTPVYCDRYALRSDGIIFLNKVKPHTDFRGPHESGLAKMMAIGIANHKGANYFHQLGFESFAKRIPEVCQVFLEKVPIAFGIGLVQNAYDEISELEVIPKEKFLERDAALLEIAKRRLPTFKHRQMDLLIVDEIGKNISGNGHDPNITGRSNSSGFEQMLDCKKLFIRGLSKESHHNGAGICCADVTTRRCLNSIDFQTTWTNIATVNLLRGGAIPMYVEDDQTAIALCLKTCCGLNPEEAKIVRIVNTLQMEYLEVSLPYYECLKHREDVDLLSTPYELQFDDFHNCLPHFGPQELAAEKEGVE